MSSMISRYGAVLCFFAPILPASAFSVAVGYRDNPCTATFQSASLSRGTSITLNATYRFSCEDGTVITQPAGSVVATASYNTKYGTYSYLASPAPWSLGFLPVSVTYNTATNQYVFRSQATSGATVSKSVPDPFYAMKDWAASYWAGASNSSVSGSNLESWEMLSDAVSATAGYQKYNPASFSVSQVFPREYPAFPFDMANPQIEDASSQSPRALLKINFGSSNYFAMVYCFPGYGDNDMYSKPIVVGDAFDPGDSRDAYKIYSKPQYANLLSLSGKSPRKKGYDVFFLDFSQGGGNLCVNAMLELKFIEWISARAKRKIVVGGPSMSGLVARLALLYSMPRNNVSNGSGVEGNDLGAKVMGYLSIDSPHQGANIAPGVLQDIYDLLESSLVLTFGDKGSLRDYRNQLNSPAAHMMLYEHYYGPYAVYDPDQSEPIIYPSQVTSEAHDVFYGFLASLGGYRPGIPKISIAYSNAYRPHPGYTGPYSADVNRMGTDQVYRKNEGNAWDFVPGSHMDAFYSSFAGANSDMMKPVSFGAPSEKFKGTYIPLKSALDLDYTDPYAVQGSPDESQLKAHSPFDAVYYMRSDWNGYCTDDGHCSQLSVCDAGSCRKTIEDKRYEHVVFDNQMMDAIASALDKIESLAAAKYLPAIESLLLE
jgi:hypothetical protein